MDEFHSAVLMVNTCCLVFSHSPSPCNQCFYTRPLTGKGRLYDSHCESITERASKGNDYGVELNQSSPGEASVAQLVERKIATSCKLRCPSS